MVKCFLALGSPGLEPASGEGEGGKQRGRKTKIQWKLTQNPKCLGAAGVGEFISQLFYYTEYSHNPKFWPRILDRTMWDFKKLP